MLEMQKVRDRGEVAAVGRIRWDQRTERTLSEYTIQVNTTLFIRFVAPGTRARLQTVNRKHVKLSKWADDNYASFM